MNAIATILKIIFGLIITYLCTIVLEVIWGFILLIIHEIQLQKNKNIKTEDPQKNNTYDLEKIIKFSDTIKERGEKYYKDGKVIECLKTNHGFYAKVQGSNNQKYTVNIVVNLNNNSVFYDCTCPCEYPCKHEYAVLKAIENKQYNEINEKNKN